jgi:hypothetical protein
MPSNEWREQQRSIQPIHNLEIWISSPTDIRCGSRGENLAASISRPHSPNNRTSLVFSGRPGSRQKRAPGIRPLCSAAPSLDQRGDQRSRTIDNVTALFRRSPLHSVWVCQDALPTNSVSPRDSLFETLNPRQTPRSSWPLPLQCFLQCPSPDRPRLCQLPLL